MVENGPQPWVWPINSSRKKRDYSQKLITPATATVSAQLARSLNIAMAYAVMLSLGMACILKAYIIRVYDAMAMKLWLI